MAEPVKIEGISFSVDLPVFIPSGKTVPVTINGQVVGKAVVARSSRVYRVEPGRGYIETDEWTTEMTVLDG